MFGFSIVAGNRVRGLSSYLLLVVVTCAITIGASALKMTPPIPSHYHNYHYCTKYYDIVFIQTKKFRHLGEKKDKIRIATTGLLPIRDARMVLPNIVWALIWNIHHGHETPAWLETISVPDSDIIHF